MARSSVSMTFTGQRVMAQKLERLENAVPKFLTDAVREEWKVELAEMKRIVPLDTGDLRRSGKLTVRGSSAISAGGSAAQAEITFGGAGVGPNGADINYAIVQHEDMTLLHRNGREAKYVETPLKAAVPHMKSRISARYVTLLGQFFRRV